MSMLRLGGPVPLRSVLPRGESSLLKPLQPALVFKLLEGGRAVTASIGTGKPGGRERDRRLDGGKKLFACCCWIGGGGATHWQQSSSSELPDSSQAVSQPRLVPYAKISCLKPSYAAAFCSRASVESPHWHCTAS
eukprot:2012136-Rhodomonas_salina.1